MPLAMAAEDTTVYSDTTVIQNANASSLADLRFVHNHAGIITVSLPDGDTAYQSFAKEFGLGPWPTLDYFRPMPDEKHRARAIEMVDAEIDDSYCVIAGTMSQVHRLKLVDFACMPDGGGGVSGFIGVLERPDEPLESVPYRPIGLALQRERCEFATEELSFSTAFRAGLESYVNQQLRPEVLLRAYPFCIAGPDMLGALLHVQFGEREILVAAYRDAEGVFKPIQMPTPVVPDQHGLVLENPSGENDVAPHDSKVRVMPDVDRNGTSEVFIQSQVSFVLTLEKNERGMPTRFATVMQSYIGP